MTRRSSLLATALLLAAATATLFPSTTSAEDDPSKHGYRAIDDGYLKAEPLHWALAEFSVAENNKKNPKSEPLKLVSLDKGFYMSSMDFTRYVFYLTCNSTQLGVAKYAARVSRGNGFPNFLESFSKLE